MPSSELYNFNKRWSAIFHKPNRQEGEFVVGYLGQSQLSKLYIQIATCYFPIHKQEAGSRQ